MPSSLVQNQPLTPPSLPSLHPHVALSEPKPPNSPLSTKLELQEHLTHERKEECPVCSGNVAIALQFAISENSMYRPADYFEAGGFNILIIHGLDGPKHFSLSGVWISDIGKFVAVGLRGLIRRYIWNRSVAQTSPSTVFFSLELDNLESLGCAVAIFGLEYFKSLAPWFAEHNAEVKDAIRFIVGILRPRVPHAITLPLAGRWTFMPPAGRWIFILSILRPPVPHTIILPPPGCWSFISTGPSFCFALGRNSPRRTWCDRLQTHHISSGWAHLPVSSGPLMNWVETYGEEGLMS
ncbi:hypothetical protein K469DRAFT_744563 [Zopfia rhizophila CBS 207.26]|uniref:Uncharacterized protein n=1 Tax=Zopfia rhizophila CBS 207.26 TaxID=1314779 RepID=A0A6A6EUS5_9PEZI|nr:hypothetical protein K469DRAFT_744563 [Zopfia rhizophila CBS 207.26]